MTTATDYPDRPGVWRCQPHDGSDPYEFEVYPLPGGELCAWCDECGREGLGESEVWDTDEWLGHVPTRCLRRDGVFTLIKADEEAAA